MNESENLAFGVAV